SFVAGVPTVAMAFVSYLGVFVPGLATNPLGQMAGGIALIAAFTFINIRGLKEMSVTQITLTVLKIIPLIAIIAIAVPAGAPANAPAFNPSGQSIFAALTLTALIALWPFTGFEVVTLPAGNVKDCERTIPRALITGMLTVVVIYLSATVAVMLLVSPAQLMQSTAPFSDAARALGPWGPGLIAAGALVATAGTINGLIFTCGQMPLAVAADKLAPSWLAAMSKHGTPHLALLLSSALGIVLLVLTNTRGLMGSFQFMLTIATSLGLFYYVVVSLAELRHSTRASAFAGIGASIIGIAYSIFAAFGSGLEVLLWCIVLMAAGVPLYFVFRRQGVVATAP
ncbi:MAG: amino acid permease, partial [Terricaulis sp.]